MFLGSPFIAVLKNGQRSFDGWIILEGNLSNTCFVNSTKLFWLQMETVGFSNLQMKELGEGINMPKSTQAWFVLSV